MELIVLGVDGVDPDYLDEAIEERNLEGFEELKKTFFYSRMESTVPAVTIPAWQTLFSGKDPGAFGAYHMAQNDLNSKCKEQPDSNYFYEEFFWDRIDDLKFGIHNVPGTSPSYPINGIMRSGFPSGEDFDIYPQSFKEKVVEELPEMPKPFQKSMPGSKIDAEFEKFEIEGEILERMIEEDPDVLVSVVKMTDDVSHFAEKKSQLFDGYEKADTLVQKMIELAENEEASLLVMSDHGFGYYERKFNIAAFLRENGYLKLEEGKSSSSIYDLVSPLTKTFLKPYLKIMYDFMTNKTGSDISGRGGLINAIDFERSDFVPVFSSDRDFGLKLNPEKDHENSEKKVENLKERLEENDNIYKVFRGDEIYSENSSNPDLIGRTVEGVLAADSMSDKVASGARSFAHDTEGVFFAGGPDIDEDSGGNVDIYEVAPAIYRLLGKEVPEDVNRSEVSISWLKER